MRNNFNTYELMKPGMFGHSDLRNQVSKEAFAKGFDCTNPIPLFNEIWDLQLSDRIPEKVLDYLFHVFNLWLMGWFYYPLFTHANFMALYALEIALKDYYQERDLKKPNLHKLLPLAIKDGLFRPEEFTWVIERYKSQIGHSFEEDDEIPESLRHFARIIPIEKIGKDNLKALKERLPNLRNKVVAHPDGLTYSSKNSRLIRDICEMICQIFTGESISVWEMLYPNSVTLPDFVVQATRDFALSQTIHNQIWHEGMPLGRTIDYFAWFFPEVMDKNESKILAGKHLPEALDVCFGKDAWVVQDVSTQDNSRITSFILVQDSPGCFKYITSFEL